LRVRAKHDVHAGGRPLHIARGAVAYFEQLLGRSLLVPTSESSQYLLHIECIHKPRASSDIGDHDDIAG
jgi:hypothetical protein